jgi:carboxylesterase type B
LDCRKADIGDAFTTFLSRKLSKSPDVVSRILSSYHIDKDASDDNVLKNILRFANDVFFYAPTVCIARAWKSGAAYVYRFDQGNPWEGRWQGEAAHITDLTMLLQNYNDFLPDACRAIGRDYARDILVFASGRSPWSAYQKAEERPFVQNYGSLPEGRREFIWGLMKDIGADNLMALLEAFIVEG